MDKKLLAKICRVAGPPGYEQKIRNVVLEEIKGHVDSYQIDNMGNLIALKKGRSAKKKVMMGAHMDEIAFMVTHIDDAGFVRFHTLGGFDPKTLTAQRVIVHGKKDLVGVMGAKPIHVMTQEERNKVPKMSDYFVDLGMKKEEVLKYVSVGDTITRERDLITLGDCISSKSIDNRISVYALIEILKQLEKPAYDFYAAFTVQEEVGIRGANVATMLINPDFALALDTTIAFDTPGAAGQDKITKLGEGAGIKVMDAGTICDYRMVRYLRQLAEKEKIKFQMEVLPAGGTDTSGLQRMTPGGSIAGAISFPTRHLHQVIEMVHKEDVETVIKLSLSAINSFDSFNWEHE